MLLAALSAPAYAQEAPQPILAVQFSFSNPGARSLGMGGAFVAIADDATAAWANPAGLVQIGEMEVSAEIRHWRYSSRFVAGGRISGEPSGIGLDTVDGLRTETSESQTTGISFLSFVYPRERWSVAIYRHVLSNLETTTETEGLFGGDIDCCLFRVLDQRNRSTADVVTHGLSGAYRISDSISLGLGVVYHDTDFEIQSDLYVWDDIEDPLGSGTSYPPDRFVGGQTIYGSDGSLGLTAGLLWRLGPRWSLGARYREGPKVDLRVRARAGHILDVGIPPGSVVDIELVEEAELPDNFGLGVAYRSSDGRLTVGFEWDRVTYSDSPESLDLDDQFVDDGDRIHLGGEWALLQRTPIVALRAGVWHEPDHQTQANENADDFTRALLQPGEDELHFALGLGMALESFQIDAAVDVSDSVTTASVSAIYSF